MPKAKEKLFALIERACTFPVEISAHEIDRNLIEQFDCGKYEFQPEIRSALSEYFRSLRQRYSGRIRQYRMEAAE